MGHPLGSPFAADTRVEMEATKREHDRQLKEKDDINEALKLKMNDMAEEFAEMLQVRPGASPSPLRPFVVGGYVCVVLVVVGVCACGVCLRLCLCF